ncbi:DUF2244 domain-containing protein [Rhizobium sp. SSA_523]|uniref:DUF2244 domain-containing protein n=1 Tax=Rhizobium sp. SSA_523 TaxID=2952477 RepID=UPI002090C8B8|nr:DUF2244 domain-containing protein [Rhizobium sp. SSA_523]MCO5731788.1 DUF2244 domain-containing protein [Rhizobium sp. SSA_523]WKC22843.1 DUF2244 domain-containing protein [Rhizobium sp. SSA_523]
MEGNVHRDDELPVFSAELTPYRSLGRQGYRILLALTGLVCLLHAGFFLATGAWPIGLFFGLDFLLLWGAFWLNYRSGRAREEVTVSRTDVSIRKYSPAGRVVEHHFNPFWARFRVRRHEEFGITKMVVTGEGRHTDIGSFLNPDDRESFAKAFRGALATVKQRI